MKVMITGSGGQLGTDLVAAHQRRGHQVLALTRSDLDVADSHAVRAAVESHRPDAIMNCAAWTAVDDCESDPERAERINGHAVGFLSEAADLVGAHLVHVSTDYVFSGDHQGPHAEDHPVSPRSAYGRSKVLGEQAAGDAATVVRTSWVCSAHGGNMVATIARLASSHPTLRFVADQHGRPTFTSDLAQALVGLADQRVPGVVHFANQGTVSWFEFAQAVLEAAGHDPSRVEPIMTADLDPPRPAPRPTNSELSTARYESLGLGPIRHFTEPLSEVIGAYA